MKHPGPSQATAPPAEKSTLTYRKGEKFSLLTGSDVAMIFFYSRTEVQGVCVGLATTTRLTNTDVRIPVDQKV